jgi:hypothetical protein
MGIRRPPRFFAMTSRTWIVPDTRPCASSMVFKLVMAASRTWRRLQGQNQLPKVVNGIKFKDGIEAVAEIKSAA